MNRVLILIHKKISRYVTMHQNIKNILRNKKQYLDKTININNKINCPRTLFKKGYNENLCY